MSRIPTSFLEYLVPDDRLDTYQPSPPMSLVLRVVMKLFNEWNKMVRTNSVIVGFKLEIYNKLQFNVVPELGL